MTKSKMSFAKAAPKVEIDLEAITFVTLTSDGVVTVAGNTRNAFETETPFNRIKNRLLKDGRFVAVKPNNDTHTNQLRSENGTLVLEAIINNKSVVCASWSPNGDKSIVAHDTRGNMLECYITASDEEFEIFLLKTGLTQLDDERDDLSEPLNGMAYSRPCKGEELNFKFTF